MSSNRITHPDLLLLQHREIETRALARQDSFDDVRAAESDAELITRQRGSVAITMASRREICHRRLTPFQKVPRL